MIFSSFVEELSADKTKRRRPADGFKAGHSDPRLKMHDRIDNMEGLSSLPDVCQVPVKAPG
jgi:hypothetical protein